MKFENFLPPRMSALWFTYVALFLFSLLPGFGVELKVLEILGYSLAATIVVNAWSWYRDTPIMDERKQEVVTEAMAWAFVAVSIGLIVSGAVSEPDTELIRDTASLGLWTWLIAFSVKNLYHKYGKIK